MFQLCRRGRGTVGCSGNALGVLWLCWGYAGAMLSDKENPRPELPLLLLRRRTPRAPRNSPAPAPLPKGAPEFSSRSSSPADVTGPTRACRLHATWKAPWSASDLDSKGEKATLKIGILFAGVRSSAPSGTRSPLFPILKGALPLRPCMFVLPRVQSAWAAGIHRPYDCQVPFCFYKGKYGFH